MGWLTNARTNVLRNALVKAAKRASLAERELAWHERLPDVDAWREERDYTIHRCERLIAHAVAQGIVSERGARRLAGCIYDAVASERRGVKGRSFAIDPDGHWQRMEALAGDIERTWGRDRWRAALERVRRRWDPRDGGGVRPSPKW
jgi:hypothetical protein